MKIRSVFKAKKAEGTRKGPQMLLPIRAAFDAASRSEEAMSHWKKADALSADAALNPEVRKTIIHRARFEVENNGYAAGILKTLADDCIGTGPRLQLSSDSDDADEAIEKILERREKRWKKWCKNIGLSRLLWIARRSKAQDGEIFIRKGLNARLRNEIKLSLTLYESEQVGSDSFTTGEDIHPNGAPKESDGIFFDKYGNPVAYRFWNVHPGANAASGSLTKDSHVEDAKDIIHYANIERGGQHRGKPEISTTLYNFNDTRRYTTATLEAAETAASFSMLLKTSVPPMEDDGTPLPAEHMDAGSTFGVKRNTGMFIPEGWEPYQMKAEQPTSNHEEFLRTKIREAARPFSMPMNVALGDSSGYNYASGRLDHQVYFRTIALERKLIEDVILDDVYEVWRMMDAVLHPEDYILDDIEHKWMWDGFAHVDPLKEANAQNVRMNNSCTTTLAEECGNEGKDYIKVIRQRIREEKFEANLREKYGLDAPQKPELPKDDNDEEEKD